MRKITRTLFTLAIVLALPVIASAQRVEREKERIPELPGVDIKTNLLYDLTTTMNLGVEFRTGGHTSVDIPVNWNPWSFKGGETKLKHVLVQPEFRYWVKETFRGSFFGLHGHWGQYNVGGLPHGPFSKYMRENNFQGWLAGAGVSYGYRWNFSRNWGLEATLGVGYAHLDYDEYVCESCATYLGNKTDNYWGPTKAGVTLIFGIGRKKEAAPVAVPVPAPVAVYQPTMKASFITPAAEPVKARSESGKAYLEYVVGRSDIREDFRGNSAELALIHDLIDRVKEDSDITITGMTLTGHASPEDTAARNQTLSQNRAQALKEYLKAKYGFTDAMMTSRGAGEDWTTLEELVGASNISEKARLLEVIRGTGDMDAREGQLKAIAGGAPYNTIKAEMYPKLRRTDYVVNYEVAPISVERGREILHTRPGNLSLNEMFRVADSYPLDSDQAKQAYDIAAKQYPDSDVANLNAAASALTRKATAEAAAYLSKVKDHNADYWNNAGMLAWQQGDKTKAAEAFTKAGSLGSANAAELRKHLETMPR